MPHCHTHTHKSRASNFVGYWTTYLCQTGGGRVLTGLVMHTQFLQCVSLCEYRACVSAGCRLKRHSLSQHQHSLLGCEASSYRTLMFDKGCKMYFSPPYLVISTWRGTDKHMQVHVTLVREGLLFLTEPMLSWPPLSRLSVSAPLNDMLPEWTWHLRLTGAKWAISNDRGHPAHWLIVLNNEPGSPLWLVLEVGGWQLADLSAVHSTPSQKWICRMAARVAGVKPPFFHPPTATLCISPRRRLLSYCAVQEYPSETAFVSGLASVDLKSQA